MDKLVIFCKSYDRDMLRAYRLTESISRFNTDKIPFYLSVPQKDLKRFKACFNGIPCHFLTDEQILAESAKINGKLPYLYPTHLLQQLIKLEFWRMGLCKNFVWIDSDSYFIKPFQADIFISDKDVPFTVHNEFIPDQEIKKMNHLPVKERNRRINRNTRLIKKFKTLFHNSGPDYNFGHPPIIWSTEVLKHLYENYMEPQRKTIYELLYEYPSEMQLYGEYLYYSNAIPINPSKQLFKTFHYADDFIVSQIKGESEYSLSKKYYGICIQSNWTTLNEKRDQKERLKKHFKEYGRALGLMKIKN
ncbi:MAG: DUF6492 family protein [Desulfobacterales bacterium]|nr:DUF6492 family protein [Desulfobacterales bacterium]